MKGLLFTYALTYGGALASFYRPFYGLLIYVCFAIIRPESLWHWSVPAGGNYSRIVAIAFLLGWGLHGFGNWNLGRSKLSVYAFIGFFLWMAVSTATVATNSTVAYGSLEEFAKILLPFVAGVTLIKTQDQLKQLAWVILLSQGYVALDMNLSYYNGVNPLMTPWGTGGFGGMDNNCVAIAMVTGAGLAFFMGMHVENWKRWVAFAAAGLMVHTTLFSFSRGGMVGLIIMAGVCFVLIDKSPKHYAIFAMAAFAGLMLAGPEVREEFSSVFLDAEERDYSATSRLDMWEDCVDVIGSHPLLGVGPNHWPLIAQKYGWPAGKEAHSLWLQTGAELGAVGLGLLLTFYLATMGKLWGTARRRKPNRSEWDVGVARMYIASMVGFIVSAQFVSLEGLELPYYVTLVAVCNLKLVSIAEPEPVYDMDEEPWLEHEHAMPWQEFEDATTA